MAEGFAIAAFGALCVWVFQIVDQIRDRKRRRQSTLVAIASEVQAISNLIRSEQLLENYHSLANTVRSGEWDGTSYVVDIRSNYTRVFEANASKLSDLESEQVSKIVAFYAYAQALIDGTKPGGSAVSSTNPSDQARNIIALEGLLTTMLAISDEIVRMPKVALPVLGDD